MVTKKIQKKDKRLLSELRKIGKMKGYKSLDKYLAEKYLQRK